MYHPVEAHVLTCAHRMGSCVLKKARVKYEMRGSTRTEWPVSARWNIGDLDTAATPCQNGRYFEKEVKHNTVLELAVRPPALVYRQPSCDCLAHNMVPVGFEPTQTNV